MSTEHVDIQMYDDGPVDRELWLSLAPVVAGWAVDGEALVMRDGVPLDVTTVAAMSPEDYVHPDVIVRLYGERRDAFLAFMGGQA